MTVDRSLYEVAFDDLPDWPCPTCGKGHLKLDKGTLLNKETGPSKDSRRHPEWDPDWIEQRFCGMMECDFGNCGELVAIMGSVSVEERYSHDSEGDWRRDYGEVFRPLGFSPAPLPIRPPVSTPKTVKGALREAAGLLWQSPEGAANQVRQAVEYLMDEQGVTKSTAGAFKALHERIKEFEAQDPTNAEILLAVKWLGNSGSHAGGITRDDVLDAFDMIELVLVNLYDTSTADIMAKVKAINSQKGPVKKSAP